MNVEQILGFHAKLVEAVLVRDPTADVSLGQIGPHYVVEIDSVLGRESYFIDSFSDTWMVMYG